MSGAFAWRSGNALPGCHKKREGPVQNLPGFFYALYTVADWGVSPRALPARPAS